MGRKKPPALHLAARTAVGTIHFDAPEAPAEVVLLIPDAGQQKFYLHSDGVYRLLPEKVRKKKPVKNGVRR